MHLLMTYQMVITTSYGALEHVELRGEDIDMWDKCKAVVNGKDINKSGDFGDIKINSG